MVHLSSADGKAPDEVLAKVGKWEALAASHGCTLPAVAMAFAALPAVSSAKHLTHLWISASSK